MKGLKSAGSNKGGGDGKMCSRKTSLFPPIDVNNTAVVAPSNAARKLSNAFAKVFNHKSITLTL